MPIYVIKKFVESNSMQEALDLEKDVKVHECWLHEDCTKIYIENTIKKDQNDIGFKKE